MPVGALDGRRLFREMTTLHIILIGAAGIYNVKFSCVVPLPDKNETTLNKYAKETLHERVYEKNSRAFNHGIANFSWIIHKLNAHDS